MHLLLRLEESLEHLSVSRKANTLSEMFNIEEDPLAASSQFPNMSENDFQCIWKSATKHKRYSKIPIEFASNIEIDEYIRVSNQYPVNVTHSMLVNCKLCLNHDNHRMSQIYRKCACRKINCDLAYKINNCKQMDSAWTLAQTGSHPLELVDEEQGEQDVIDVRVNGPRPKKRYGIALRIQQIFNKWLKYNNLITAKRLLSRLVNRRNENLNKPIAEQDKRYQFNKYLIPSSKQVLMTKFLVFNWQLIG